VQSIAYGNKRVILSSALGVQRARQAVGPLPPPSGLQVVPGISEGTVTLTWDKVKHALLYFLEYGVEGEKPVQIPLSGRRKKKLTHGHLRDIRAEQLERARAPHRGLRVFDRQGDPPRPCLKTPGTSRRSSVALSLRERSIQPGRLQRFTNGVLGA
jgi:hypothetical protein